MENDHSTFQTKRAKQKIAMANTSPPCKSEKPENHDSQNRIAEAERMEWENMYNRLVAYKRKNGHCLVPFKNIIDLDLGKWVNKQRLCNDLQTLPPERKERLSELGMEWRTKKRLPWDELFDRLVEYKENHGHCLVPQRFKEDPQLGRWVDTQRENFKDGRLKPEHRIRLTSIGFVWYALNESWDDMFDRLVAYKLEHGDTRVAQRYDKDPKLGKWVKNQRLRRQSLQPTRAKRLESIGFVWEVSKDKFNKKKCWEIMYKRLVAYKERHGHSSVPQEYSGDIELATWVHSQRKSKSNLAPLQLLKLNNIGFSWNLSPGSAGKVKQKNTNINYAEQQNVTQDTPCNSLEQRTAELPVSSTSQLPSPFPSSTHNDHHMHVRAHVPFPPPLFKANTKQRTTADLHYRHWNHYAAQLLPNSMLGWRPQSDQLLPNRRDQSPYHTMAGLQVPTNLAQMQRPPQYGLSWCNMPGQTAISQGQTDSSSGPRNDKSSKG